MKKVFILFSFFLVVSITSCNDDDLVCPDCYTHTPPFRMAILDDDDINLLDPSSFNYLTIKSVNLGSKQALKYEVKDYIVPQHRLGFYFLESIDNHVHDDLTKEGGGEIHVAYNEVTDIDTFSIYHKRIVETKDDGCICTYFSTDFFRHNGKDITDVDTTYNTGAVIIRK